MLILYHIVFSIYFYSLPKYYIIYLFLCLFSLFIYLEIIELNFCGLNENIKIKIEERGKKETNILLVNTSTSFSSDSDS